MPNRDFDFEVFTAMQEGDPVAVYKKTVLAKVYVTALNVFSKEPEAVLLFGDPNGEEAQIKVWSIPEDIFFKRQNRKLFEQGLVVRMELPKKEVAAKEEPSLEQATDEELRRVVKSPYKAIEAALNKTESEALVFRMLNLAREEDRSERIIKAMETRLAEIQNVRFTKSEE